MIEIHTYYLNKITSEIHVIENIKKQCNVSTMMLALTDTVRRNQDTNYINLGKFLDPKEALLQANVLGYYNADGCKYCNEIIHTK